MSGGQGAIGNRTLVCACNLQLAAAQLDCQKRDKELETERLRVEALKWELTKSVDNND